MGYYINPSNESKESFLNRVGRLATPQMPEDNSMALVCLVDNGMFTAAGVCYDKGEMEAFNLPSDFRPKWWYEVPKHLLYEVVGSELERVLPRD